MTHGKTASVLCCYIPDFLLAGACSGEPGLAVQPLALVGADGCVWAATPAALATGVRVGMRPPAARLACPGLRVTPLAWQDVRKRQAALLAVLGAWELPVEGAGWGLAYIDLAGVANCRAEVHPLAADLGRRVRAETGMQPALGWGTGKFTARAGAQQTAPGRMRLVEPEQTAAFLAGQAVTLLPLDEDHLRQLHWLGVRTLGQFARLPAAAVWQRFGAAGKLAQQWARGKDDRPVCGAAVRPAAPVTVTFDPLACTVQAAAGKLMASLRPLLDDMQAQLTGVLRLHMACMFDGGGEYNGVVDFLTPENRGERVQAGVTQFLGKGVWPAPLASVRWTLLASGEVSVAQLRLFAGLDANVRPMADTAAARTDRYEAVFFQGQRRNANHPIPDRGSRFVSLGAGGRSGDVATLA